MSPPLDDYNGWADFWRYKKGFNVIPKKPLVKEPLVEWKEWQNKPIPEELHNHWKFKNMFKDGMAIVLGRVWHRRDLEGLYVVAGDADNALAIKEIIQSDSIDLATFASKTLVEQYEDSPDRMHFLMYSIRPILPKEPSPKKEGIPWLEIKCLKRLLYVTPTPNTEGKQRQITDTDELRTLDTFEKCDAFEKLVHDICNKYGLKYGADNSKYDKPDGALVELDNEKIDAINEIISPYYTDGVKDLIVFSLSGFLYKVTYQRTLPSH